MSIEILCAESLGVRGLCCYITTRERRILIDPGIALGFKRYKLLPHPFQISVDEGIQAKIKARWRDATDIVISHFHGDHVPIAAANPYQLNIKAMAGLNPGARIWSKAPDRLSPLETERAADFSAIFDTGFLTKTGGQGDLTFSRPVPHGSSDASDTVMMTRVRGEQVFVHASDIQLLNEEAVLQILDWAPDVALVGGLPLYLARLSDRQIQNAWHNALHLAGGVDQLILDHHLLRDVEGEAWLDKLSDAAGRKVICGADFMERPRMLLEAARRKLYADMPVSDHWHENYATGRADTQSYRRQAKALYPDFRIE